MLSKFSMVAAAFTLFSASTGLAQNLIGIERSGDVIQIDTATGTAALIGSSGFVANAAASDSLDRIFTIIGLPGGVRQLIQIDPETGTGSVFLNLPGCFASLDVRGMAFDSSDALFVALDDPDLFGANDVLATIDMTTGVCAIRGDLRLTGIQALAFDPQDNLFCLNVSTGLCSINLTTSVATTVGAGQISPDRQALEFDADGTLFAARANLVSIDPITGDETVVGPTGFSDIRGLALGAAPPVQIVEIDIKPGSDPNCVNNDGNGKIAVAIFGSADLDAAQVDPSTIDMEGLSVATNGNNTKFQASIKDVDKDSIDDFLVQIEDVAGVLDPDDITAVLTGELFDGTAIEGSDSICVVQ